MIMTCKVAAVVDVFPVDFSLGGPDTRAALSKHAGQSVRFFWAEKIGEKKVDERRSLGKTGT